ncbi:MAG TPA: hypothetical protein V6C85_16405 [Allocoleopsis sp.]
MTDLSQNKVLELIDSDEEFPVNFDDAYQWVGYNQKSDAKSKLLNNFIKGVDFSAKRLKNPQAGRPSELIMMTVDCFKSFCMMAGTAKGREVRQYFLDCERELKRLKSLDKDKALGGEVSYQQLQELFKGLDSESYIKIFAEILRLTSRLGALMSKMRMLMERLKFNVNDSTNLGQVAHRSTHMRPVSERLTKTTDLTFHQQQKALKDATQNIEEMEAIANSIDALGIEFSLIRRFEECLSETKDLLLLVSPPEEIREVIEETEPPIKVIDLGKPSKQGGSLYRYTADRTGKDGITRKYPKVEGDRDPDNPNHWYWGISYIAWDGQKWTDKTLSVPRNKLSVIREAFEQELPLQVIYEILKK